MRRSLKRVTLIVVSALAMGAVYASGAAAAGLPEVEVGTGTNESLNTASVTGTVKPNGASTKYKIEYGKTKEYSRTTAPVTLSSTEGSAAITVALVGLEARSTYHFRISASNSFGTVVSADKTFEMLKDWRVEGVPVSETLGHQVTYESGGVDTLYYERAVGTKTLRFICTAESAVSGILDFLYLSPNFNSKKYGCKASIVNVGSVPSCNPSAGTAVELHLNGNFELTASTTIDAGEECPYGELFEIPKGTGLAVQAGLHFGEEKEGVQEVMTGTAKAANGAVITWSSSGGKMILTGVDKGKVFGLS